MVSTSTKFGRDVIISTLATALRSLRSAILIPFLTYKLSIADYGMWEQIALVVALLIPWLTLQLPGALIRFIPGVEDRIELREGFYSVLFTVLVISSLAGLLLWSCQPLLANSPYLAPFLPYAAPIAGLIPATVGATTVIAYLRAFRQMLRHALLTIAQNFGEIIAVLLVLRAEMDLYAALIGVLCIRFLVLGCGVLNAFFHLGFSFPRFLLIRRYLAYSLPLTPVSALTRIYDAADRLLLGHFLNSSAVGIYSAAYTAGSLFTTLINPINTVLLPMMAEFWNTGRIDELRFYFSQSLRFTCMIGFPAWIGSWVLGPSLMEILVPNHYADVAPYFPVLAASFLIFGLGILGSNILVTAGLTRLVLACEGSLAVFNVLLNLVLIPRFGIDGAVYSTLVSHIAYSAYTLSRSRRVAPFTWPFVHLLRYASAAGTMALALSLLQHYSTQSLPVLIASGIFIYGVLIALSGDLNNDEKKYLSTLFRRH
jgi:O-antigen/teichoic acid export membrane protein